MAYDNSSLTGDEICDYHYDIENNFMNPPSPTGFFIYKVIGGAFDRLNDLVTQFRIDYSILDCNVGNVEIVKSFPEEPDTNHTYYVHQPNTSTGACFTKYSYVDGGWVGETVTGDVLNSLDVFWGRSYNLPRPSLPYLYTVLFEDVGTVQSHNDSWVNNNSNITVTRNDEYTTLTPTVNSSQNRYDVPTIPAQPFVIEFDKHNTSMAGAYLLIGNVTIPFSTSFNGRLASANHLKFTIQDNKVTCEHDGVVEQTQLNITSLTYIRFQINNNNDGNVIQYSNFRVYGIVYPNIYFDDATTDTNSRYYIYSGGGTSLTWNNGYLVLTLGSSGRYVRLRTDQYDVNNLVGKKVHFEAEIDANTSCYVRLLDDNTGTVYTRATGNEITKGVSQLEYTIPSNCTQVLFQIMPKNQSGSGETIKFKNFKIYVMENPIYSTRLLSDDEYRIYLYLKNHQLLTMKDLLVAFTNAFGSAETGTTLLNSIHTVDHKSYDDPQFSNVTLAAYDEEDTDIITDTLVDKAGVNVVNDRLAQGTISIIVPDNDWDEEFLRFLESFISIKGNILISTGG